MRKQLLHTSGELMVDHIVSGYYKKFILYVSALPKDFSHRFITYSIEVSVISCAFYLQHPI